MSNFYFPVTILNLGGSGRPVEMRAGRMEKYLGVGEWTGKLVRVHDHVSWRDAYNEGRGPKQRQDIDTSWAPVFDPRSITPHAMTDVKALEDQNLRRINGKQTRRKATSRKTPKKQTKKDCKGCGKGQKKQQTLSGGPGTELYRKYEEQGVPHCPKCFQLALKMDRWGPKGCEKRLEEIVEDMLPRAREWLKNERPWANRMLSGVGQAAGDAVIKSRIRKDMKDAIEKARENDRRKAKQRKKKTKQNKSSKRSHNRIKPPNVEPIPFDGKPIRNLIYHIYPVKGNGVWRWNVSQLLKRIELFNGKRIVAIATDEKADSADDVKQAFGDEVHEFIVVRNDRESAEAKTHLPLLEAIESISVNEVTFRAHAKGVGRNTKPFVKKWTKALYRTNLEDWPTVQEQLVRYPFTGSFRRLHNLKSARWFYAGSFYWFRHIHIFNHPNWRRMERGRFGAETWPGFLFDKDQCGCVAVDNCEMPYSKRKWERSIAPKYDQWLKEHS